jgi:hypothetical protein
MVHGSRFEDGQAVTKALLRLLMICDKHKSFVVVERDTHRQGHI